MAPKNDQASRSRLSRSISLRELGKHLGLSPTTVSLVLNGSPAAASIPKETQARIFAAAKSFDYHPNFFARSLRSQRTYLVGVMVPEVSEGYASLVLSGIEEALLAQEYVYLVTSHRHKPDLIERGPRLLYERCVEGVIAVDTPLRGELPVPVVLISGRSSIPAAELEFVDAHFGFGTALDDLLWTMRILVPPKVVAREIEFADRGNLRDHPPRIAHRGQGHMPESRWADST